MPCLYAMLLPAALMLKTGGDLLLALVGPLILVAFLLYVAIAWEAHMELLPRAL